MNKEEKLAVIRVRGWIGVKIEIVDVLKMLRLHRKNSCVVVNKNPNYLGMIRKVKDYITWGEIDDETYKQLIEKRGQEYKGRETDKKGKIKYKRFIVINGKKIKLFFRLNPPKKGFGRKGIKAPFSKSGGLGYRGEKINDLIMRML